MLVGPLGEDRAGLQPEVGVVQRGGQLVGVRGPQARPGNLGERWVVGREEPEEVLRLFQPDLDQRLGDEEVDERVG